MVFNMWTAAWLTATYYHDSYSSQDCYVLHFCVCQGHHAETQISKSIQGVGLVRMIISLSFNFAFFPLTWGYILLILRERKNYQLYSGQGLNLPPFAVWDSSPTKLPGQGSSYAFNVTGQINTPCPPFSYI